MVAIIQFSGFLSTRKLDSIIPVTKPIDDDLQLLVERLKAAVKAAGGNKEVARKSGVPLSTLNSYLAAEADPKITKLARIAEVCGTSIDHLMSGSPTQHRPEIWTREFSFVPRYDVRVSAGPGAIVPFEDIDGTRQFVAFRTEWLRRIGVNPKTAEVLVAVGDSMEPTIRDGDLLLIDRSIDRMVDNGIYVLVIAGMVLLKRLQTRRDGSAVLKSDNARYDDEVVPAHEVPDLRIEGRVRWFGRTI